MPTSTEPSRAQNVTAGLPERHHRELKARWWTAFDDARRSWPEKAELRSELFEYIEVFYNRRRRHRSLGFLSPEQFETITHHHQLEQLQTA